MSFCQLIMSDWVSRSSDHTAPGITDCVHINSRKMSFTLPLKCTQTVFALKNAQFLKWKTNGAGKQIKLSSSFQTETENEIKSNEKRPKHRHIERRACWLSLSLNSMHTFATHNDQAKCLFSAFSFQCVLLHGQGLNAYSNFFFSVLHRKWLDFCVYLSAWWCYE